MAFTDIISLNDFIEYLSPDDALFRSSPMTSNKLCLQNNKVINWTLNFLKISIYFWADKCMNQDVW